MNSPTPKGLTLSALAKATGRAKSGLHKLAKRKQIPQLRDGTFDLSAVIAALEANTDPARRKPVHPAVHPVNGERPPPVATLDDALEAVTLIRRVLQEEGMEAEGALAFGDARTAETILKARERALKIAERRRELVPLAAVLPHIERAFIGYRRAIQNIPGRHAAELAAELQCDERALADALARVIHTTLDELSSPVVTV